MALKDKEKQSYTPNDICLILGIAKSTLLYWESQNSIPKARRSSNIKHSRYWLPNEVEVIASYHYENENLKKKRNSKESRLLHLSIKRIKVKNYLNNPINKERNNNNVLKRYYKSKQENRCWGCRMPLSEESRRGVYCVNCADRQSTYY